MSYIGRLETSVIALQTILKEYELKEVRGNQELMLIELSTRPLGNGETFEQRNRLIAETQASNQEKTSEWLISSLSAINIAKAKLNDILNEVKNFEIGVQKTNEDMILAAQTQLQDFNEEMNKYITLSEQVKRKVTNDYLVLRHNARVAEKILCERRQAAVISREEMQRSLDNLLREAAERRLKVEESLSDEQARLVEEARATVMRRESDVFSLGAEVKSRKKELKREVTRIRESIRHYEGMYTKLSKRREREVKLISSELRRFREAIAEVEAKLVK